MVFSIGIELANVAAVQRSHDANSREHGRSIRANNQHQRLDRGLPFREGGFLFRQIGDVVAGVVQRDQLAPVGERIGSSNLRCQPRFVVTLLWPCARHQKTV
jgi:hypothetical protein